MKILKIRLKNLNSLAGEWTVDLENPAFTNDGLFAITGQTGAGKTTIFDAVCLALYGQTPRLDRVSQTENEILSRGTADCMAEVFFSTQGRVYRCMWAQRRARGNVKGALQPVTRQLSVFKSSSSAANGDKGEILAESINEVASKVQELTHMNFEQFTRSVLLAQGRFDSFLKAPLDDRRKILESITGTDLYSNISQYIFRRFRLEEGRLNEIKAKQSALNILSQEQETKLREELQNACEQVSKFSEQHENTRVLQEWLSSVRKVQRDLYRLKQERDKLNSELAEFEPERVRLANGERAARLASDYAGLTAIRNALATDQKQHRALSAQMPLLKSNAEQAAKAHQTIETKLFAARKALDDAGPILNQARGLDQSIAERTRELQTAELALTQAQSLLKQKQRELKGLATKHSKLTGTLEQIKSEIEAHKADAALESALSGIEQQVQTLKDREEKLNEIRDRYVLEQDKVNAAQKTLRSAEKKQSDAGEALGKAQLALTEKQSELDTCLNGKSLREYRAERDAKQKQLVLEQRLQGYEQERARLIAGEPCPLCGSVHHPYADDGLPLPDPTDTELAIKNLDALIQNIESLTDKVDALKTAKNDAELAVEKHNAKIENAKLALEQAETNRDKSRHEGHAAREAKDAARNALLDTLSPFEIFELDETERALTELVATLRERVKTYKSLDTSYQKHIQEQTELDSAIKSLNSAIETLTTASIQPAEQNLADIAAKLERVKQERTGLLVVEGQSQSVKDFEQGLQDAITQAEAAERQARADSEQTRAKLVSVQGALKTLDEKIQNQVQDIAASESAFSTRLAELNFANENEFKTASLKPSELDKLRARVDDLAKRQSNLDGLQRDREDAITEKGSEHPEIDLEDKTLEQRLEQTFTVEKEKLQVLQNDQVQCRLALKKCEDDRQTFDALQVKFKQQEHQFKRWRALSELIGSSDGKKYSSFAQRVTLDLLVDHANVYLKKMSGRYTLTPLDTNERPDTRDPLALEVLDNEHGGVRRPTTNLSGGESFMVSLALALGLSQMNGQTTTIETLFLDEGFGSLDEETLDMALDALSSMRQEGRMIGIISHIEALKERIPTRIEVRPIGNGRSEIILPRASA